MTENLQKITIDNNVFLRKFNVLSTEDRLLIKKNIDWELTNKPNLVSLEHPHQTHTDIFFKYQHTTHWQTLHKAFLEVAGNLFLRASWANLSNEDNCYDWHEHESAKLTCVYYLISPLPEYGTKLTNGVNLEATENSILFFEGKITHSVANMPPILAKFNHRYSIVFDYAEEDNKNGA